MASRDVTRCLGFERGCDVPAEIADQGAASREHTASDTLPTTGIVAGTYTWSAHYSGDVNNNSANDQGGTAEQTIVSAAHPSLLTTASSAITLGTTAPTLSDSAYPLT